MVEIVIIGRHGPSSGRGHVRVGPGVLRKAWWLSRSGRVTGVGRPVPRGGVIVILSSSLWLLFGSGGCRDVSVFPRRGWIHHDASSSVSVVVIVVVVVSSVGPFLLRLIIGLIVFRGRVVAGFGLSVSKEKAKDAFDVDRSIKTAHPVMCLVGIQIVVWCLGGWLSLRIIMVWSTGIKIAKGIYHDTVVVMLLFGGCLPRESISRLCFCRFRCFVICFVNDHTAGSHGFQIVLSSEFIVAEYLISLIDFLESPSNELFFLLLLFL
mmetsp:Transcript_7554/g.15459  ORF Transcript_7554/g.15459 Transcript_7554/m.15459 type:complete len:265 (-) Transcript_7554:975-1769(-)